MKVIIDTNVLMSALFFGGVPYQILKAWDNGQLTFILSPSIFEEYRRVAEELQQKYAKIDITPVLELIMFKSIFVEDMILEQQICEDPDDDKFISAALNSGTNIIVTGDKLLLKVNQFQLIKIMTSRQFVDDYLFDK